MDSYVGVKRARKQAELAQPEGNGGVGIGKATCVARIEFAARSKLCYSVRKGSAVTASDVTNGALELTSLSSVEEGEETCSMSDATIRRPFCYDDDDDDEFD